MNDPHNQKFHQLSQNLFLRVRNLNWKGPQSFLRVTYSTEKRKNCLLGSKTCILKDTKHLNAPYFKSSTTLMLTAGNKVHLNQDVSCSYLLNFLAVCSSVCTLIGSSKKKTHHLYHFREKCHTDFIFLIKILQLFLTRATLPRIFLSSSLLLTI